MSVNLHLKLPHIPDLPDDSSFQVFVSVKFRFYECWWKMKVRPVEYYFTPKTQFVLERCGSCL